MYRLKPTVFFLLLHCLSLVCGWGDLFSSGFCDAPALFPNLCEWSFILSLLSVLTLLLLLPFDKKIANKKYTFQISVFHIHISTSHFHNHFFTSRFHIAIPHFHIPYSHFHITFPHPLPRRNSAFPYSKFTFPHPLPLHIAIFHISTFPYFHSPTFP